MIFFVPLLFSLFFMSLNEVHGSEDESTKLWSFVMDEKKAGRVIGAIGGLFPKSVKFYNDNLKVELDKDLLSNPNINLSNDIRIFGGKGVEIKPTNYPINIDIVPPRTDENICGIIIGSSHPTNKIQKVQILWKPKLKNAWDLLAVPNTGEYLFNLVSETELSERVLLFDPVPVSNLRLLIHANNGDGLNVTTALIHKCRYEGNIDLSCDEIFDHNSKFVNRKAGIPVSISCPTGCVTTKSCIGYKVYSSESPICSVAEQALSRNGDGQLFLYSIPHVAFFRDEINPMLNNGIYCKRSTLSHSGITFNRVYYDFTVKEYEKKSGA